MSSRYVGGWRVDRAGQFGGETVGIDGERRIAEVVDESRWVSDNPRIMGVTCGRLCVEVGCGIGG